MARDRPIRKSGRRRGGGLFAPVRQHWCLAENPRDSISNDTGDQPRILGNVKKDVKRKHRQRQAGPVAFTRCCIPRLYSVHSVQNMLEGEPPQGPSTFQIRLLPVRGCRLRPRVAAMRTATDGTPVAARVEALVVGAGPAGLAVGTCLHQAKVPFLILEAGEHVGTSWHTHYDRLRLHTVKRYSALPFMPFPGSVPRYPSRQEVMAYLEAYAEGFALRPSFRQPVTSAWFQDGQWHVQTPTGRYVSCYLVICTGVNRQPIIPRGAGRALAGASSIPLSTAMPSPTVASERWSLGWVTGCGDRARPL